MTESSRLAGAVHVCCWVCRRRDGLRVSVARLLRVDGDFIVWGQRRHGTGAGLPPGRRGADDMERSGPDVLAVDGRGDWSQPAPGELPWRCRRHHRLRWDSADVRRQLERGAKVVYLDAA